MSNLLASLKRRNGSLPLLGPFGSLRRFAHFAKCLVLACAVGNSEAASGRLSGQKFNDLNGDGIKHSGEFGVNGFLVELVLEDSGEVIATQVAHSLDLNGDEIIDPMTERGWYRFDNLGAGKYLVREAPKAGWIQTIPARPATGSGRLTSVQTLVDGQNDGQGQIVNGLARADSLVASPDGKHVHAVSRNDNAVAVFARNSSGKLSFVEALTHGGVDQNGNAVGGLIEPTFVSITADGRHLYVVSVPQDTLATYTRDTLTGRLTFVRTLTDRLPDAYGNVVRGIDGANSVACTADGKHVYVTGLNSDSVAVFERDISSGELRFLQILKDGQPDGNGKTVVGLVPPEFVVVTSDGLHVYVVARADSAMAAFIRDPQTGLLKFLRVFREGQADASGKTIRGLQEPVAIVASSGGEHLYVSSRAQNTVAVFQRNSSSGFVQFVEMLTQGQPDGNGTLVDGLGGADTLALAPDDGHMYVPAGNGDALSVFARSATTGRLTFVEVLKDGQNDTGGNRVDGLWAPLQTAVAPDGRYVYVVAVGDSALSVFQRDVGGSIFGLHRVLLADEQVRQNLDFGNRSLENNPPTISDLADQTINEDHATAAIAFSAEDVETADASLIVSATSSNTSLVPDANIVFVGAGANRTVTVTPAADQNGTATITVTVTDSNNATGSDSFLLVVTAVNDAPVAVADSGTVNEGQTLTVAAPGVLSNDTDAENNPLTAERVSGPAHGTLTLNP
ncbi:MAG: beta-propeller fold lactonase family protein, partial [Verrucomicrobia bacterium]|nr:beta-propeller fold lactonase family protein [Verrucomicrobiota bacterium]